MSVDILKTKYKLIQIAESMVKEAVSKINKSDHDIFLDYRQKPESQTRYWRKADLYRTFFINKQQIIGLFERNWVENEKYQAYKSNKYEVEWVLVYLIKALDVCFLFVYIIFFLIYILIEIIFQKNY